MYQISSEGQGIATPSSPDLAGTIIEGMPRVGIWLMPDNKSTGELEDFVQTMIPPDDQVWPLSESYINNIPTEFQRFRPGKVLRAQMYAWLATRRLPGRMGAAIEAEDLDINVEGCTNFVAWASKAIQLSPLLTPFQQTAVPDSLHLRCVHYVGLAAVRG